MQLYLSRLTQSQSDVLTGCVDGWLTYWLAGWLVGSDGLGFWMVWVSIDFGRSLLYGFLDFQNRNGFIEGVHIRKAPPKCAHGLPHCLTPRAEELNLFGQTVYYF